MLSLNLQRRFVNQTNIPRSRIRLQDILARGVVASQKIGSVVGMALRSQLRFPQSYRTQSFRERQRACEWLFACKSKLQVVSVGTPPWQEQGYQDVVLRVMDTNRELIPDVICNTTFPIGNNVTGINNFLGTSFQFFSPDGAQSKQSCLNAMQSRSLELLELLKGLRKPFLPRRWNITCSRK